MSGMRFKLNSIVFSTFLSKLECAEQQDAWHSSSPAGRYGYLLDHLYLVKEEAFTAAASAFGKQMFAMGPYGNQERHS
jgi:hypothetical protein